MNRCTLSVRWSCRILIVIAGIMLIINLSAQTTQVAEGPFSFILAPLQQVFSGLGRATGDLFRSAGELQDLRQRVQ